jgi:signal transduction histidine kinase
MKSHHALGQKISEVIRSSSFKLAALLTCIFIFFTLSLFGLIYWQTVLAESSRIERELTGELVRMSRFDDASLAKAINDRIEFNYHKLNYAALFMPSGHLLLGNIAQLPEFSALDKQSVHAVSKQWLDDQTEPYRMMMVGQILEDGRILVIGRSADSLDSLSGIIIHALEIGIIPSSLLALLVGVLLSRQTHGRLKMVMYSVERIMEGNLAERLPVLQNGSEFDRLSGSVNAMLDEIERLLEQAKSTGENIAHDLRTPLTRVRTRLERACQNAKSHQELRDMVEISIAGLDQALRMVTALLRIGQIENWQRRSHFSTLNLGQITNQIGDLFEPIAEENNITFAIKTDDHLSIEGDWDLLSEAIANLVDNALKFTPPGGHVTLQALEINGNPTIQVIDDGRGFPQNEADFLWKRFYRSDKSRQIDGNGLGLSIVKAIIDVHGFNITAHNLDPGCVFEVVCTRGGAYPNAL